MARKKNSKTQDITEVTTEIAADSSANEGANTKPAGRRARAKTLLAAEPLAPLSAPASQPQIAGNNVPATMLGAGGYFYEPAPVLVENGRGEAVVGPYASLRWRWNNLSKTDYAWLITTVLQGQPSRTVTSGTTLYNHLQALTEIASCVVHQPSYESLRNGRYINVELLIKRIVPA